MTPAQEAKEYAAAHGFEIVPTDRRYTITYVHPETFNIEFVRNVGGYPAALNAMKDFIAEVNDRLMPIAIIPADAPPPRVINVAVDGTVDESQLPIESGEVVMLDTSAVSQPWAHKTPEQIRDDIMSVMKKWADSMTPQVATAKYLDKWGDFPHDDGSWDRARHRRTGYYVRSTRIGAAGAYIESDVFCGSMKAAYHLCASVKNWYLRNGIVKRHTLSVIFKRG